MADRDRSTARDPCLNSFSPGPCSSPRRCGMRIRFISRRRRNARAIAPNKTSGSLRRRCPRHDRQRPHRFTCARKTCWTSLMQNTSGSQLPGWRPPPKRTRQGRSTRADRDRSVPSVGRQRRLERRLLRRRRRTGVGARLTGLRPLPQPHPAPPLPAVQEARPTRRANR